jgi:bifunctional DNA-binding transcriptional regulator/antitoxin component of YhaV-PrlF toxin-antitoxin module
MQFIRTLSVKYHPTGDHYSVSIPREIAQALGLQDGGGLISIDIPDKSYRRKKGCYAVLKAYRDSDFAWREKFDPTHPDAFRPVVISPRTLGPSKSWGSGKVLDLKEELKDARAIIRCLRVAFPHRRGRKRRRR